MAGGLHLCKKPTVAKVEGISRVSFNRKAIGSGSTTNSCFFWTDIGEIRRKPGRKEAENEREMRGEKEKLGECIRKEIR